MFKFRSLEYWHKFFSCIGIDNTDESKEIERKGDGGQLYHGVLILLMLFIFGLSTNTLAANKEGWKIYKNEKHRYEIQLPPDLEVVPYGENTVHIKGGSNFYAIIVTDVPPIDDIQKPISDIDLLKDIISFGLKLRCRDANLETLDWTTVEIGGLEGIEVIASEDTCLKKYLPWAAVKRDNEIYHFQRLRGSEDEFNEIIATVRFN
jgi:hypothetical protein